MTRVPIAQAPAALVAEKLAGIRRLSPPQLAEHAEAIAPWLERAEALLRSAPADFILPRMMGAAR